MNRLILSMQLGFTAILSASSALAFDPMAPRSMRNLGMIYVDTPSPRRDTVSLTNLNSGKTLSIQPDKLATIPAGGYKLEVRMQDQLYKKQILVPATERTDIVPTFGNLKVRAPKSSVIQVFTPQQERLVAEFSSAKVKTLPRGSYSVKVLVDGLEVASSKVLIVSNNTSVLKVKL